MLISPFLIIGVALLLGLVALYALFAVYLERKISAFIQDRLGPMEVGPYGLLQTLADIIKLVVKENIIHSQADKGLFMLAPIVVFVAVFTGFSVVAFAPDVQGAGLNVGVMFLLAIVSVDVVGLLMAGWGSNNKYSLYGAVRAVAQIISYEIPVGLAILAAVMVYGTLELNQIAASQSLFATNDQYFLGFFSVQGIGGFLSWGVFLYPHLLLVFILYFIASLAEANRTPFDISEAESEIIAGYLTEYSGFRFALLMLAEYANMLLISFVGVTLFLGGWASPLPNLYVLPEGLSLNSMSAFELLSHLQFGYLTSGTPGSIAANLWGVFWISAKGLTIVGLQMWVRWTLPRLRADQLMNVCWKYLTPIGFILVFLSAAVKLLAVYSRI